MSTLYNYLVWALSIENEKLEILFFSGIIVTSLADIFTMKISLDKIIFGC